MKRKHINKLYLDGIIYPAFLGLLILVSVVILTRKQEFIGTSGLGSIKKTEDAIAHAAETGDVKAYLSYFTDSVTIFIPDTPTIRSKDALRLSIQSLFASNHVHASLIVKDGQIRRDWAVAHVTYQIQLSPKTGGTVTTNHGDELVLFHRVKGKDWCIYRETFFSTTSRNQ